MESGLRDEVRRLVGEACGVCFGGGVERERGGEVLVRALGEVVGCCGEKE